MIYRLLLGLTFLLSLNNVGAQSTPNVVVSIKPIHSIVSALMEGVSRPQLLLESSDSAHTFHLKPSQLKLLSNADLVITIGDDFETGLKKTLGNIKDGSHVVVSEINDLNLYDFRNVDIDEINKDEKDEHSDHDEHEEHTGFDLHLWLDIINMQKTAQYISEQLIKIDPNNKNTYEINLVKIYSRLNKLKSELQQQLAPFRSEHFAIYSDTLQYFEKSFHFQKPVIITPYHGARLSIHRTLEARKKMKDLKIKCLLYGPENTSKKMNVLSEGLGIKAHRIDILGAKLDAGSDQYFNLMERLSSQLVECLG
jgi:zinc transport system substrate-binding protein